MTSRLGDDSEVWRDPAGGSNSGNELEDSEESQYSNDKNGDTNGAMYSPSHILHSTRQCGGNQHLPGTGNLAVGTMDNIDSNDVVDKIICMAMEEQDSDNEEYLSASDGEGDDEKMAEWSDVQEDLKSGSQSMGSDIYGDHCYARKEKSVGEISRQGENAEVFAEGVKGSEDGGCDRTLDGDDTREGAKNECDENETVSDSKEGVETSQEEEEKEAEHQRKELEDSLTEEERQERLAEAVQLKTRGNEAFKGGQYAEAKEFYSQGLDLCPLKYVQQRSIMLSNRAACLMKELDYEEAVKDCSKSIDLQPTYIKAINRRADAYEKLEKLEEALKDHQTILQLDPSQAASYHASMRLPEEIKERNEKLKTEMLGKLKDLGNMVLRPFGLSTNNFQLQQDPNTGSYSVQFTQTPPRNGH